MYNKIPSLISLHCQDMGNHVELIQPNSGTHIYLTGSSRIIFKYLDMQEWESVRQLIDEVVKINPTLDAEKILSLLEDMVKLNLVSLKDEDEWE